MLTTPMEVDASAAKSADDVETPMETSADKLGKECALGATMDNARDVLKQAMHTISALRIEKEDIALQFETALSNMREENAKLRKRFSALESHELSTTEAAKNSMEDMKNSEDKLHILKEDITELRLAHERLQRQNRGSEEALAKKIRKSAEDAALIQKLRSQVSELLKYRMDTESKLSTEEALTFKLTRDVQMNSAESVGIQNRCEFLEKERVRMSGEREEARSQLEVHASTHSATIKTLNANIVALRKQLATMTMRADTHQKSVELLQKKMAEVQRQHEKERADALAETKNLNDLVAMHKEELKDTNAEVKRYKALLDTITSSNMQLATNRAAPQKSLDAHAEALLKDVQTTLEEKIGQLEQQRILLDRTLEENSKIQIDHENLMRELNEAQMSCEHAFNRNNALNEENQELSKKVRSLEDRILLAAAPHGSDQHTPYAEYLGARIRRESATPGSVAGAPSFQTPLSARDDRESFGGVMEELRTMRHKHDSVLAALAATRNRRDSIGTHSDYY